MKREHASEDAKKIGCEKTSKAVQGLARSEKPGRVMGTIREMAFVLNRGRYARRRIVGVFSIPPKITKIYPKGLRMMWYILSMV